MTEPYLDNDIRSEPDIRQISVAANVDVKIKRSQQILDGFCCGYLVGKICHPEIKAYDVIKLDIGLFENVDFSLPLSDAILAEFSTIRASYPVGIDVIGMFITQPENGNLEVAAHLMSILGHLEDISHATFYAVCLIKPSQCTWHVCYGENQLEPIENISVCAHDLFDLPLFRVQQEIEIDWLRSKGEEGLQAEIDKLDRELVGHKHAYLIKTTGMVLHNDDYGLTLPEMSCRDIIDDLKSTLGWKQWPLTKASLSNVIEVAGLTRITTVGERALQAEEEEAVDDESEKALCNVPVLLSHKLDGERLAIRLCIDAFVATSYDTPAHTMLYMFRDAVFRQRSALCLLVKNDIEKRLYAPFHFQASPCSIPVTAMLPSIAMSGEDLAECTYVEYRKNLHERFLLPHDRTIFRRILSLFSTHSYSPNHLINPHEGLNEPELEGGVIAVVNGKYAYHHYMQDGFNDDKWGCAYRSLQTLASWFWLQGYTERTYPSHQEIQKTLVEIGDKDESFVGSKDWIGSMEVSYTLEQLYGITSRTLHCSTGADLAYKGRELYNHFMEEGTPIMIGGGVLAHSIVGVKYNEYTGATRFLIVDPHFTGRDQLKTVQSKGWVGWKGPDFWNQTAHYNLCMPFRPRII